MVGIIKIRGNHRTSRSKRDCSAGGAAAPANGAIVSAISNIKSVNKRTFCSTKNNLRLADHPLQEAVCLPSPSLYQNRKNTYHTGCLPVPPLCTRRGGQGVRSISGLLSVLVLLLKFIKVSFVITLY